MNLSYRGVKYNEKPLNFESIEGENFGKYRSHQTTYRYPRHIAQLQPKILQYGGVLYSTQSWATSHQGSQNTENSQVCVCSLSQAPLRKPKMTTTAEIHLENLRQNLERRLQVAKSKGDEDLINLLEREYQQLAQVS